ncbi:MAG: helix-turn-helix domain-containing protein [Bacteroidales bacterium]|nr:helix-turn-helix domain-containing protein [Bacteroidales bacterium]
MSGKDLRNFLYLNGISQDEAAKLLGVKRQTINNWCNKEDLKGNILTKAKFIIDHFSAKISETNISGVVINGNAKDVDKKNDQRKFYSDSPDVLRAQIEVLDERIKEKDAQIKEKDAQIKEKDAQISKLLEILNKK